VEDGTQTGKQTAKNLAKLLKYRCSIKGTPCFGTGLFGAGGMDAG
jgi:hypothetical protein